MRNLLLGVNRKALSWWDWERRTGGKRHFVPSRKRVHEYGFRKRKKRCKKQGLTGENQLTSGAENATIYELSACCGKVCLFGALFCRH